MEGQGNERIIRLKDVEGAFFPETTLAAIGDGDGGVLGDYIAKVVQETITQNLDDSMPIGTIRLQLDETNPRDILGFGQWEPWGAGRCPVGIGAGSFTVPGALVGAETVTLGANHLPSHLHPIGLRDTATAFGNTGNFVCRGSNTGTTSTTNASTVLGQTGTIGQAHSNIQPSIVCYMFIRVEESGTEGGLEE